MNKLFERVTGESLELSPLTEEEKLRRGILGRLSGVIADTVNPTRNGRKYSKDLWELVFSNPITEEKIVTRACIGELGHPADRTETDMTKAAIVLCDKPVENENGELLGTFDILNTPCGQILKTLLDYGTVIGVSSRGSGDTEMDYDGTESVIPDTYQFECFDAVLLPAVKNARPKYVTESYNGKTLNESLNQLVENATDENTKKILQETLDDLRDKKLYIDYESENSDNISNGSTKEVDNAKSLMMEQLANAIADKAKAEGKLINLQEKLSVCYAKETEREDYISQLKSEIDELKSKLSESLKLKDSVKSLKEELVTANQKISETSDSNNSIIKQLSDSKDKSRMLSEELSKKQKDNDLLKSQINKLTEALTRTNKTLSEDRNKLVSEIQSLKKDSSIKDRQYKERLEESTKQALKYKSIATQAVDKYIQSQANMVGITPTEIKNRLSENYTFTEIDKVVESLQQYKLNMNKLPYAVDRQVKAKVTQKKEPMLSLSNQDDEIDESLLRMLG